MPVDPPRLDCGHRLSADELVARLCPKCLLHLGLTSVATDSDPGSDSALPTLASPSRFDSESPTALYDEHRGGGRKTFTRGQLLGQRYRIESLLGRGGMGEVWRAYDLKLRLEVALKSLHPRLFESEDGLELLRDEVRAAREVVSPNVCRLFDLVEVEGRELVSMEYIDGVTLLEHLKEQGPLELKEANEIASQLLAGLEAVHEAGLVHRDVKPENTMLTRAGRVVVMDFGLTSPSGSGTVGGTPAYMPPEQARGEATDARADVFSAGMVLAEMLSAERGPDESSRQTFWEEIRKEPPVLPESPWKQILSQALSPDAEERYDTAADLARALEEVAFRVEGVEHEHPYPGLASFQQENSEFFFGREAEVEAVWKKLQQSHLLGLIGPSGSGKSSFINAGLVPAIPEGWFCVQMSPGTDPFAALGRALLPKLETDKEALDLLSSLEGLDPALEVLRGERAKWNQVLIVVDQFEELFSQGTTDVQERFAELLGRAALEADVHVLLSMRDDYLMHCRAHDSLVPLFSDLTALLPPMGSALRRAIVQPALRCGYRFEDESVVEEMLQEVTRERAALPLIAFTAARLWERRDEETGYLTREAYRAIGEVGGALAQHAESTLEAIGQDKVPIIRELFRNLVTADGTRASRDRDELLSVFDGARQTEAAGAPAGRDFKPSGPQALEPSARRSSAAEVLNALINSRLLTTYEIPEREDRPGHQRIEIVHESLLKAWPRLVRWQAQDAEGAQLRDELRNQAQLWEQHDRSPDYLWTGAAYLEYLAWRERYPGGITGQEEAFASAMTSHAERRKRRTRIAVAAAFAILLVVLGVIGGFWRSSVQQAHRAEAANLLSLGQLRLEMHPTAALAYATASLELVDSPDSRRLALEALGRGPPEFRLLSGSHYSIEFSPDGRWLALADPWSGCTLWPWDSGSPIALESSELAMEVQISPRGDLVAATMDRERQEVGLWSFPEGRFLRSFSFDEGTTVWYQFSLDGKRLLTPTEIVRPDHLEFEFRSWPVDGGEPDLLARVTSSEDSVATFAGIDPANGRLAWVDGERLNIAPLEGSSADLSSVISLEHEAVVAMAAFDPKGRRLATLDQSDSLRIWSLEHDPPELIREMDHHGGGFGLLRFDPSGTLLADWGWQVWNLEAPADAAPLWIHRLLGVDGENPAYAMAFDPTGRWLATGGSRSVSLWHLGRSDPLVLRGHESYPNGQMKFTGENDRLVSMSSEDGSVRLWSLDGRSGELSRILYQSDSAAAFPNVIDLARDASIVAIGTPVGKVIVRPLDGQPGRELSGFTDAIQSIAVGPRGRFVAAGAGEYVREEAVVRVWDLETGGTRILDGGDGKVITLLKFTGEDDLWSGSGLELRRWDLEGGESRMVETIDLSGGASSGARMRDLDSVGRRVLGTDGTRAELWVYDLDARSASRLTSHGTGVRKARFDSTGELVVSGDRFGAVRIGPATGGEPHLLLGHEPEVNTVTVSPDGRWIASGADDGTVRVWPMPDLSQPPPHTLPREELLARLRSLTNVRAVRDPASSAGWKLEIGPFPGWEEVPKW